MATEFDVKMSALSTKLINKFGKQITYIQNDNTINPITGDNTLNESSYNILMAPPSVVDISNVDESVVQAGDVIGIIDGDVNFSPKNQDIVLLDGVRYNCVSVQPTYSGELIAIYNLVLRTTEGV